MRRNAFPSIMQRSGWEDEGIRDDPWLKSHHERDYESNYEYSASAITGGLDGKVGRKVEMESWRRRGVGQQQSWIEIRIQRGNEIQVFFFFHPPPLFFETIDNFSIDSIRLERRGEKARKIGASRFRN